MWALSDIDIVPLIHLNTDGVLILLLPAAFVSEKLAHPIHLLDPLGRCF